MLFTLWSSTILVSIEISIASTTLAQSIGNVDKDLSYNEGGNVIRLNTNVIIVGFLEMWFK